MTAPVLLALETSGPVGSVAVAADGAVRARRFLGEAGGHAPQLVPAIQETLQEAGITSRDLTGVAVGAGPGSFTGVRVAASAAKGLTHALGLPLWPVSSLLGAVLTEQALPGDAGPWPWQGPGPGDRANLRYVLLDARGDRFFAAVYRLGRGLPALLRPPHFVRLQEVLADSGSAQAVFCGDGALRHAGTLEASGRTVLPPPFGFPSADGLLRVLALDPERNPVDDPWGWEPEYLRATSAERAAGR